MLTIEALRTYGANVEEGLSRCLGEADFYLSLVQMCFAEDRFDDLKCALQENDLKGAFEITHALKGMYGNLALTPLTTPIAEMTELLRAGTQTDYTPYFNAAKDAWDRLKALAE